MTKAKVTWTKKSIVLIFATVAFAAIAMLWWRVRRLENSVESLTRQLKSRPGTSILEAAKTSRSQTETGKQYFHLIDSPPADGSRTKVGVPWQVERAMMGDANKARDREIPEYEIQIESSSPLLEELNSPQLKQQPNAPSNDGGFN